MAPMMRLVLGLGVLVLILSAVALGLPAHVTAARSVVINAPEYVVYPYVNNLRRYPDWSPWADRDPDIKMTYSGPSEGRGATVKWESQVGSVGTGSVQILDSTPSSSVDLLANVNGLEGKSRFELSPAGAGSKVTWSFSFDTGSSPLKRWKGLMLDGLIGSEYKKGLEKLKQTVEADRAPAARPTVTPPVAQPAPAEPAPDGGEDAAGGETTVVPEGAPAQTDTPPPPPQQP